MPFGSPIHDGYRDACVLSVTCGPRILWPFKMLCLFHRPSSVEVEGVHKVLRGIERGTQKRFLHYYAPRTGKTLVQASLAYWLMRLSTLDLAYHYLAAKLQQKSA